MFREMIVLLLWDGRRKEGEVENVPKAAWRNGGARERQWVIAFLGKNPKDSLGDRK